MHDDLGDRMKQLYESQTQMSLMPLVPVIARLDGKNFHTFTKGLQRPYDVGLSMLMQDTTQYLVKETNARIGYAQSDEISLVYYSDNPKSQIMFDGKLLKMVSVLSAMCSVYFNKHIENYIPSKKYDMPVFDCRVFNVPTKTEAVNYLIWREKDATRNSVSMAAQSVFSHKELDGKSHSQKIDMLFEKGIEWNKYPIFFKRGTYVRRKSVSRVFTIDELDRLPAKHQARLNPNLTILRSDVVIEQLPPLVYIKNREGIVFNGEDLIVLA